MRNLLLITTLLCGCWGGESKLTEPVLSAPQVNYQAAPEVAAYSDGDIAPLYPEAGKWTLDVEYSVSQRAAGKPDLDVRAIGRYTLNGNATGSPTVSDGVLKVRPAAKGIEESLTQSMPSLIARMFPQSQPDGMWVAGTLAWKPTGQSDLGVVLESDTGNSTAWLLVDKSGVVKAAYKENGDETRADLDARQKWRITLSITKSN
ncbi:MAG TPA: hypothetical protein EYN06_06770 [Myxococcales bacterium]|nr:hypothetical protein [Myxococcales bacterium]HIN86166.1 hypothetical protein [Myxococcales bacterium]